jgi:hypothetical protein
MAPCPMNPTTTTTTTSTTSTTSSTAVGSEFTCSLPGGLHCGGSCPPGYTCGQSPISGACGCAAGICGGSYPTCDVGGCPPPGGCGPVDFTTNCLCLY